MAEMINQIGTWAVIILIIGLTASVGVKVLEDYRITINVPSTTTNQSITAAVAGTEVNLNLTGTDCIEVNSDKVTNGSCGGTCNNTLNRANYSMDYTRGKWTLTAGSEYAGDNINLTYTVNNAAACSIDDAQTGITNQTGYLGIMAIIMVLSIITGILVAVFYRRTY